MEALAPVAARVNQFFSDHAPVRCPHRIAKPVPGLCLAAHRDAPQPIGVVQLLSGRAFVNVQVAGSVRLILNGTTGLRLWIEGKEIADLAVPVDLGRGRRAFTFAIDRSKRGEAGLRVEFAAVPGSPAKVQPEGGK